MLWSKKELTYHIPLKRLTTMVMFFYCCAIPKKDFMSTKILLYACASETQTERKKNSNDGGLEGLFHRFRQAKFAYGAG
jgi:hypothetical protein